MPSTDHSREYIPVLAYGPALKSNVDLGTGTSFGDLQATVAEYFGVKSTGNGTSFLQKIV
jgi:phosphopentomutase